MLCKVGNGPNLVKHICFLCLCDCQEGDQKKIKSRTLDFLSASPVVSHNHLQSNCQTQEDIQNMWTSNYFKIASPKYCYINIKLTNKTVGQ